ncbi:MAG TPA: redox-sensing transcriptional repressor Rex [Kiritimatiellia bacterium]|nr:redox-sensing transcriptional repressor Rex [Kiritimatiellia bacterium]HRZ11072.1 redox-sensing transcriptional repressor Rex [Kiritimatiellia bacterium]HSA18645.1 redox-sensing transcriptional repressor Rex [Kiritimatiellia bacterium]
MLSSENTGVPARTVERLVLYRRLLNGLTEQGVEFIHSHEIAEKANNSAAQVRRDLMAIGYTGNPARGYAVNDLVRSINGLFEQKRDQKAALVGIGKLGRAILGYFALRQARPRIVAAFDSDPAKGQGEFAGCPCYPVDALTSVIARDGITVGILTVPADFAQPVTDLMLVAGVRGILNFAPTPLKTPAWAVVDNVDIATKLEKVAFFC